MADESQEEYEAGMEGEETIETDVPTSQPAVAPVAAPASASHASHPHKPHEGQPSKLDRLKAFYRECLRVFKITKKPNREEFTTIVKISGVGILIIGAIGFLIHLVDQLLLR